MDRQVDIAVAQPKTRRVVVVVAAAYKFRKLFEGTFIYLFFADAYWNCLAWLGFACRFGLAFVRWMRRTLNAKWAAAAQEGGLALATCHLVLCGLDWLNGQENWRLREWIHRQTATATTTIGKHEKLNVMCKWNSNNNNNTTIQIPDSQSVSETKSAATFGCGFGLCIFSTKWNCLHAFCI